jgi:hypothetical protein
VDEHFVEAARAGPVGGFVAEVPFAEDAGGVAGGFEDLREGDGAGARRSRSWMV